MPKRELLRGTAHTFGDHINTDLISPAQYMELDRRTIAAHAMEGVDPDFPRRVRRGDLVIAGENFGSGSSRETAPLALKACGISAVIARSFARIFYRNCLNIGLPALICNEAGQIGDGDVLEVDLSRGIIRDVTRDLELTSSPLPEHILRLIDHGGLMGDLKARRKEEAPCTQK